MIVCILCFSDIRGCHLRLLSAKRLGLAAKHFITLNGLFELSVGNDRHLHMLAAIEEPQSIESHDIT